MKKEGIKNRFLKNKILMPAILFSSILFVLALTNAYVFDLSNIITGNVINSPQNTIVLQNGLNSYSGTEDSSIKSDFSDSINGNENSMQTWCIDRKILFLKFDLSSVSTERISSAKIYLNNYQWIWPLGNPNLEVYELNDNWNENSLNYNNGINNKGNLLTKIPFNINSWNESARQTYVPKNKNNWIEIDVTNLIDKWKTNNNGIRLQTDYGRCYNGLFFYTSEYSDVTLRPKLVIEYISSETNQNQTNQSLNIVNNTLNFNQTSNQSSINVSINNTLKNNQTFENSTIVLEENFSSEKIIECVSNWQCSEYSSCSKGKSVRECIDLNNCNNSALKPETEKLCCILKRAYFEKENATEGENVNLILESENCEGNDANLTIYETDGIFGKGEFDDLSFIINSNQEEVKWKAKYTEDKILGIFDSDPEYIFNVQVNPEIDSENMLSVGISSGNSLYGGDHGDIDFDNLPTIINVNENELIQFRINDPSYMGNDIKYKITGLPSFSNNSFYEIPAFPGAEGYGARSVGGRYGKVIIVSTLNKTGPGSFYNAIRQGGPRIIVFNVSGVIDFTDLSTGYSDNSGAFMINSSDLTIAGQTAPGAGITLKGMISTPHICQLCDPSNPKKKILSNLIVRSIRIRPNYEVSYGTGEDSLRLTNVFGGIFDHITTFGSNDDTAAMMSDEDITYQWVGFEEPQLGYEGEGAGLHNYGVNIGYYSRDASIHHNYFAHMTRRTPLGGMELLDLRNNVIYNFNVGVTWEHAVYMNKNIGQPFTSNLIGNYFKTGPNDNKTLGYIAPAVNLKESVITYTNGDSNYFDYINGINGYYSPKNYPLDKGLFTFISDLFLADNEYPFAYVKTDSAVEAYNLVLAHAGSLPRDYIGNRTINDIKTREGSWGVHYPPNNDLMYGLVPTQPLFDSDKDGMPDSWEISRGLNPNNSRDYNNTVLYGQSVLTYNGNPVPGTENRYYKYTYIEYYINELEDQLILDELYNSGYDYTSLPGYGYQVKPTFSLNPHFYDNGIYNLTITADNGTVVITKNITLNVINKNRIPYINPVMYDLNGKSIQPYTVYNVGDKVEFEIYLTDLDNENYTYNLNNLPSDATLTKTGETRELKNALYDVYLFKWTPTEAQNVSFDLIITDDEGDSYIHNVSFIVNPPLKLCSDLGGMICPLTCDGTKVSVKDTIHCCIGKCLCTNSIDCDDSNSCTDESCLDGQCSYVNNANSCDDSYFCTEGDTCIGGKCISGVRSNSLCLIGYDGCSRGYCNPELFPEAGCGNYIPEGCMSTAGAVLSIPFDGDFKDYSGRNNNPFCNGTSCPSFITDRKGNLNSAGLFDGIDDYFTITNNPDFNTPSYTITAWIKSNIPYSNSRPNYILSKSATANVNAICFYAQYGKFYTCGTGYPNSGSVLTSALENKWIHLAITRNESETKFYLNGTRVATFNTSLVTSNNLDLFLGAYHYKVSPYYTNSWNGLIDDLKVYNRVLSQEDINEIINPPHIAPSVCGNNIIEAGEWCDGTNLYGDTCETYGYYPGTLKCRADCFDVDTSLCGGKIPCSLKKAYWSINEAVVNTSVSLIVEGERCDNENISFVIKDNLTGGGVLNNPANVKIVNDRASVSWKTERPGTINPNYYFSVNLVSNPSVKIESSRNISGLLKVIKSLISCSDSDGGNNYYAKGTCFDNDGNHSDEKISDSLVKEYSCINNICTPSEINCANGASEGYCQMNINYDFIAYYDFNDNYDDKSLNNLNGIPVSNVSLIDSGFYGKGLKVGSGGYVKVIDNNLFDSSNYTILAWVNSLQGYGAYQQIVKKGVSYNQNGLCLQVQFDKMYNCGSDLPFSAAVLSSNKKNQWLFLGVVRDENNSEFFLNGVSAGEVLSGGPNVPNIHNLSIGSNSGTSAVFNGTIDELMIFNRTLTAQEILFIYNSYLGNQCTDNDHDGYSISGGICGTIDCNDNDIDIYPNAIEKCDEKDNQCLGNSGYSIIDEGCNSNEYVVSGLKVVSSNWPDPTSMKTFSQDSIRLMNASTDEEKALAVWRFIEMVTTRTDGTAPKELALGNTYITDPMKIINVYGPHWCDGLTKVFEQAWRSAGYRAEKLVKNSHTQAGIYYTDNDGVFRRHLFDMNGKWYVYDRTGSHLATVEELATDWSLIYQPSIGLDPTTDGMGDAWGTFENPHEVFSNYTSLITLRTNEKIKRFWDDIYPAYQSNFGFWGDKDIAHGPYTITSGSGVIEYSPDLSKQTFKKFTFMYPVNLISKEADSISPNLHSITFGQNSEIVYEIKAPYIISDAMISGEFYRRTSADQLNISISTDNGKTWKSVWNATTTGLINLNNFNIAEKFSLNLAYPAGLISPFGRYGYLIKINMKAGSSMSDVGVNNLTIKTIVQNNIFSLPQLFPGRNNITVAGLRIDNMSLKITYTWDDLLGAERKNIVQVETLPYTYEIITSGRNWSDIRMKSIEIEAVSKVGDGNKVILKEIVPTNIINFGPKDAFNTEEIKGGRVVPALKTTQQYINDLNSNTNIIDALSGLIVLKDKSSLDAIRNIAYNDPGDGNFNKYVAVQALYQVGGRDSLPDLYKFLRKDSSIKWKYDATNPEVELGQWRDISAMIGFMMVEMNETAAVSDLMAVLDNYEQSDSTWSSPPVGLILSLERLGDPITVTSIRPFIYNPSNTDVRITAVHALGELGDTDSILKLREFFNAGVYTILGNLSSYGTIISAEACSKLGDTTILPNLYKMLLHSDENYRGYGAEAIGRVGDTSSIPYLNSLLQNEEFPWVREAALNSISMLSSGKCLVSGVSWSQQKVTEGQKVNIIVNAVNCEGLKINITIMEKDVFSEDDISEEIKNINFINNYQWTAKWETDEFSNPEYYIKLEINGTIYESNKNTGLLTVIPSKRSYITKTINLIKGKNSFSIPVILDNMTIGYVFKNISSKIDRIYTYDNGFKIYYFDGRPSNLNNLEAGRGYIILMKENATLIVNGSKMNSSLEVQTIKLRPGWNFIGTFSSTQTAQRILSGVNYESLYIYDSLTKNYKSVGFNDNLDEKYGYWIYVDKEYTINPITGGVILK